MRARFSRSKKQLLKKSLNDVSITLLFTDENILTVVTAKNRQNHRLHAHPSTKKKDVVTKRLRARLTFSH